MPLPLVSTPETRLSRSIKFVIFLAVQIPSILCSIFVLYYMFVLPAYRQILANHVIIALLIVSLLSMSIDLSITLHYLREGNVLSTSSSFCQFWIYFDYSLYSISMLLMAWAAIERHILVFASHHFRSFCSTLFGHYLPILLCIGYPLFFYLYAVLLYPCERHPLSFDQMLCGSACFKHESFALDWFDMLGHSVMPCAAIIAFSLGLLIRVIREKRRIQQRLFSWRRQRRMVVQLLSIASLYIIMNVPLFIIILIRKCCLTTFAVTEYKLYFFYLYFFLILFLPFVCLGSLGGFRKKLIVLLRRFKCWSSDCAARRQIRGDQRIEPAPAIFPLSAK